MEEPTYLDEYLTKKKSLKESILIKSLKRLRKELPKLNHSNVHMYMWFTNLPTMDDEADLPQYEMSAAGIPSIRSYVYDECWVALTRNTTSFALSYLNFADSLLKLFNPSTRALVNESLVTVFHSHLRHIEQAVRSERLKKVDPKFVQGNSAFLLDTLLSLIEHRYQEKTDSDCPKLGKLHTSYSWLKDGTTKPPSSKERENVGATNNKPNEPNVSKYMDPNYV